MMDLQHRINYRQFKEQSRDFNELKELYERRVSDLTDRLQKVEKEFKELNTKYNRLVVVHASFGRVNRELVF